MAANDYHRNEFIFKTISALRIVVGVAVTLAVLFAMVWLIDYSSDRPASSYNQQTLLLRNHGEDKKPQKARTFFEALLNKKPQKNEDVVADFKNMPDSTPRVRVSQQSPAVKRPEAPAVVSRPEPPISVTRLQSPQSESRPAIPTPVAGGVFAVQLGSFQQAERARIFSEHLAARGYQPYILDSATPEGARIYRVRVGRFSTREEAMSLAVRIEKIEKMSVFVTSQ